MHPVEKDMLITTQKNNLTSEEEHIKLQNMITSLTGPQQITVIEILRQNNESLPQDEEGTIEMEFCKFTQKSIDDLKSFILSVTSEGKQLLAKSPISIYFECRTYYISLHVSAWDPMWQSAEKINV